MVRLQLPPAPPTLRRRTNDQQSIANSEPIAGSSNRRTAPFEGANAGAIPAPAAIRPFRLVVVLVLVLGTRRIRLRERGGGRGRCWERPVVKQDHVCPT